MKGERRKTGDRKRDTNRSGYRRTSSVRIGAGKWKGRRVEVPPSARPTSARARESLFDLLGESIVGARVLDLYAGSGAVGLEAISRGAAVAVLLERDSGALEKTLERLGPEAAAATLLRADAREAVRELARTGERFDVIFGDPPYGDRIPPEVAAGLAVLLRSAGRVILQRDSDGPAPELPGLRLRSRRAYGRNVFYFLERAADF